MRYIEARARARDKRVCKNADAIRDRGGARADSPRRVRARHRGASSRGALWPPTPRDLPDRESLSSLMPVRLSRPRTILFAPFFFFHYFFLSYLHMRLDVGSWLPLRTLGTRLLLLVRNSRAGATGRPQPDDERTNSLRGLLPKI